MPQIDQVLARHGVVLPIPPAPAGSYVPVVISGSTAYVSGQIPMESGKIVSKGKLGRDVWLEAGQQAARLCCINALAQLKAATGSLDRIARVVKVTGYVNSDPQFTDQPKVVNGASDFLVEIFGDKGRHARSAVGVSSLPFDSSVELELVVELGA